ncbi:helix-hairpin-helix domain-containing protein [Candidatus Bartonella washoeensis]|uniref:helix-hairpin-helix domain-containing protein n=1 Tax=Candidatus Bartonella washoeensis TaxID=186739 RepID=UPI003CC7DBA0
MENIGPTRKKALLHHFGSAKAVANASLEDLIKVKGISVMIAQKIHNHLMKNNTCFTIFALLRLPSISYFTKN